MERERNTGRLQSLARQAMAAGLTALLLAAGTLSASHWLHGLLHRDASQSHHLCLACAFAKGQAGPPVAVALLSQPTLQIGACAVVPGEVLLPTPRFLLPRTRGPPGA